MHYHHLFFFFLRKELIPSEITVLYFFPASYVQIFNTYYYSDQLVKKS